MEVSPAKTSKDRSKKPLPLTLAKALKSREERKKHDTTKPGHGKQQIPKKGSDAVDSKVSRKKKKTEEEKERAESIPLSSKPAPETTVDGELTKTAAVTAVAKERTGGQTEKQKEYRRKKERLKKLRRKGKLKGDLENNLQPLSADRLNGVSAEPFTKKGSSEGQENGIAQDTDEESSLEDATEDTSTNVAISRSLESIRSDWKFSQVLGGRFSNIRPLFSKDEKYFLLAQAESIKVYSLKTSQLVRSLSFSSPPASKRLNPSPKQTKTTQGAVVVGFAYHPSVDDKLYALTANGDLWLWDWIEGTVEGWWKTKLDPSPHNGKGGIAVTEDEQGNRSLWTYERKRFSERKVLHLIRKLLVPEPVNYQQRGAPLEPATVHATARVPKCLRVLDSKTFTLIYGKYLVVGHEHSLPQDDSWGIVREIPTESELTCMDVHLTSSAQGSKKNKKKQKQHVGGEKDGDIVVGDDSGVIYIYNNVLRRSENDQMTVRRLHWHREAVGSVQWSLDGTYVLSGGKETVLVIWQVATSRQQFLPHLSGVVEDILISPRGRHYGVRLGDNSVMVLNTAELKPQANICGIQSRLFSKVSDVKEVINSTKWHVPCVIHPIRTSQLLLAVPTSQLDDASSPYLQTFDTAADRSISRQALTRTLATQKNVAPDGTRLKEPTVKHMAISSDGLWLAAVDEWAAPAQDFVDSAAPPVAEKDIAKEVFLRFWRWNEPKMQWELVTRIDDPHASSVDSKQGAVYDLVASPKAHSFVSTGEDGKVKFWKVRARTRAGVKSSDHSMVVWGCRSVTEIRRQDIGEPEDSRLAFSADGSVLAVSSLMDEDDEPVVRLVDPDSGVIRHNINSLKTSTIFGLAMIDRFLIVAGSERLVVWNLVTGVAQWGCELASLVPPNVGLHKGSFIPNIHIAADQLSKTFAVAVNHPSWFAGVRQNPASNTMSHVNVFSPVYPRPLIKKSVDEGVVALASVSGASSFDTGGDAKGYVWIDGNARVRFLGPRTAAVTASGAPSSIKSTFDDEGTFAGGLSNSYKTPETNTVTAVESDEEMEGDEAWDGVPRILRSDALAKLFPAPAYASPALEDVFETFMGLVGEKSRDLKADEEDDTGNQQSSSSTSQLNTVPAENKENMQDGDTAESDSD